MQKSISVAILNHRRQSVVLVVSPRGGHDNIAGRVLDLGLGQQTGARHAGITGRCRPVPHRRQPAHCIIGIIMTKHRRTAVFKLHRRTCNFIIFENFNCV